MRFALIATCAAAAVAVPLALAASGPQMSGEEFVGAVRCAAYAEVSGAGAGDARWRLNAEAQRQPADTVAIAEAEVRAAARAAIAEAQPMADMLAAACAPLTIAGIGPHNAG